MERIETQADFSVKNRCNMIIEDEVESGELKKVLGELERAESHLARIREEETTMEAEVRRATEELKDMEAGVVTVHVIHVNEVERAKFKEKKDHTLKQVWDKSYEELKIPREPKDVFQTGGDKAKSLMSYLNLTLRQARKDKVIEDYHFGIASETGGA
jgi:hypothetical protein